MVMETYWLAIVSAGGLLVGGAIAWFIGKSQIALVKDRLLTAQNDLTSTRVDLDQKNKQVSDLAQTLARLETTLDHERKASGEKLSILNDATMKLRDTFSALSAKALKSNNQSFLALARNTLEKYQVEAKGDLLMRQKAVENLVSPIKQSLDKVDVQIQELEKARMLAYGSLIEQIKSLMTTQEKLQSETGKPG